MHPQEIDLVLAERGLDLPPAQAENDEHGDKQRSPLRPAANMKPKWPSSWLPRVKLTRLCFMLASLAGSRNETEPLEPAVIGSQRALPQRIVGMVG